MPQQDQLIEIRKQLIEHIKKTFPENKQDEAIEKIESMNDNELIEFLEENNLIRKETENKCIFCSIISEESPSTKISEIEDAIAILEINPISEGHSLIVPKEHLEDEKEIHISTKNFSKKISEKIQEVFSPNEVKLIPSNILGHEIINILPIYNNETINSPRKRLNPNELKELKEKIDEFNPKNSEISEKEQKQQAIQKEVLDGRVWKLPKRIP